MYFRIIAVVSVIFMFGLSPSSWAQQGEVVNADEVLEKKVIQPIVAEESPVDIVDPLVQAEAEDKETLAKKIKLAKEMHKIRPTRDQVENALNRAALSLPEESRISFFNAMRSVLNYKAIERISVDAMVETFTLIELESMVEYYSKPEAKSASGKTMAWAQKVHPEIVRMIDKAMMRVRTGGTRP